MEKTMKIESESRLSFWEATSVIIGHGIGSGILAVPFLASRNRWWDFIWILLIAYGVNLLLHYMIAELSLNNGGAQFIKCFENELFKGKIGKIFTYVAFAFLGFSVLMNISSYITGSAAVFTSWFNLSPWLGKLIYYVLGASVVYVGMKLVGICEKISVFAMIAVIGVLFVATLVSDLSPLPISFISSNNMMALYSMVAFSLSAVMSTPQVVKGLNGDTKKIRLSIAAGTGINAALMALVTFMTMLGAGTAITKDGALVDLSAHLGGWVAIVGYIFSLLALSTSFWANTLNMRDILSEQFHWNLKLCWLIASLPCLLIALFVPSSFVGLARIASVIQVLTGIGVIVAYNRSRKREGLSPICGKFGTLPFQLLVILSSVIASVGSILSVT